MDTELLNTKKPLETHSIVPKHLQKLTSAIKACTIFRPPSVPQRAQGHNNRRKIPRLVLRELGLQEHEICEQSQPWNGVQRQVDGERDVEQSLMG